VQYLPRNDVLAVSIEPSIRGNLCVMRKRFEDDEDSLF